MLTLVVKKKKAAANIHFVLEIKENTSWFSSTFYLCDTVSVYNQLSLTAPPHHHHHLQFLHGAEMNAVIFNFRKG